MLIFEHSFLLFEHSRSFQICVAPICEPQLGLALVGERFEVNI